MKAKILGLMFLSAVASAAFTDFTRPAKAAEAGTYASLIEERSWVVGSNSVRRFFDPDSRAVCYVVIGNNPSISCAK